MGEFADPLETRPKRASRAIGLFIRMEKHWLMYSTWRIIVKSSWGNAAKFSVRCRKDQINLSLAAKSFIVVNFFDIVFLYIHIYCKNLFRFIFL